MSPILLIALKGLVAGALVVIISVAGSALRPRFFSGLLAGAPAVAAVSLLIAGLTRPESVPWSGRGMALGAVGMVGCCTVATVVVPAAGALRGSAAGWAMWGLLAFGLMAVLPR